MKSLELNWIKNEDKSLPIPEVIYKVGNYGGEYFSPEPGNIIFDMDGKAFDMKFGVIVLNPDCHEFFADHIAHEWRHHWQEYHGWKYDGIVFDFNKEYYDMVFNYFTQSMSEMDALRFELKSSNIHEQWKPLLYPYIKDLL